MEAQTQLAVGEQDRRGRNVRPCCGIRVLVNEVVEARQHGGVLVEVALAIIRLKPNEVEVWHGFIQIMNNEDVMHQTDE